MKKLVLLFFSIVAFGQNEGRTSLKSKFSVVSLDKMNVVYRGIPNPISIVVNDAKSFKITGEGVVKTDEGKYIIRPGAGTETKVFVEIEKNDGSKIVEEHIFRIKGFPKPVGTLSDEYCTNCTLLFKKSILKNAIVNYKMIDFLVNINSNVTQFKISLNENKSIIVFGNQINNEAFKLIEKASDKDYFIISEIKTNYNT